MASPLAKRYIALERFIETTYPCGCCGVPAAKPHLAGYGCDLYDRLPIPDGKVLLIDEDGLETGPVLLFDEWSWKATAKWSGVVLAVLIIIVLLVRPWQ